MIVRLKKHTWLLLIILLGVFLKLTYFTLVLNIDPEAIFFPDSDGYIQIGKNLFEYGAFSQSEDPSSLQPDSMRLPLFPIIIYLLYFLNISAHWFQIAVILATGFATWLVYNICFEITTRQKVSLMAAAIYAIDPLTLLFSNSFMTEVPFQILILLAFWLQIKKTYTSIISSAILWGLSFYFRPIVLLLPIVLYILQFKNQIKASAIGLLIFLLFPSAWMYRNFVTFDQVFVSTVAEVNLFYHFLPELNRNNEETKNYQIQQVYIDSLQTVQSFRNEVRPIIWSTIQERPLKSVYTYIKTCLAVAFKPLRSYFDLQLNAQNEASGVLAKMVNGHPITILSVWIQLLILLVIYTGIFGLQKERLLYMILFTSLYFILVSGFSVPDARFRLPSMPFLAILGAVGVANLYKKFSY